MSDTDLLHRFASGELEELPHRDHVKVVYLRSRQANQQGTVDFVRDGLRALTTAAGVPEKFHETITVAWARLVSAAAQTDPSKSFAEFIDRHPEFNQRDLLSQYYSRERLFSPAARTVFVEPDLQPLP